MLAEFDLSVELPQLPVTVVVPFAPSPPRVVVCVALTLSSTDIGAPLKASDLHASPLSDPPCASKSESDISGKTEAV